MGGILQGQFLVAASHLRDPNFYRTVVLMLDHNEEGAMGLIINRPSSICVDTALSGHTQDIGSSPVFVGGPVETSSLFILHNCIELGVSDREVAEGVFVTGSEDSFANVVSANSANETTCVYRVYCGYAGWAAGQLESELERGDWHMLKSDGGVILEEDPYGIWELCTRRIKRAHRLLPHDVRNPEWN